MKLTRGNNKKKNKRERTGEGRHRRLGGQDKGRMRRREGEGLWRDTGEGAEERRGERAGMRGGGGNNGERPIRWLIGKKKKEQRGRRGSGVSRARRPTFAWKSRLGGRRHYEGEKKGEEKKRKGKFLLGRDEGAEDTARSEVGTRFSTFVFIPMRKTRRR